VSRSTKKRRDEVKTVWSSRKWMNKKKLWCADDTKGSDAANEGIKEEKNDRGENDISQKTNVHP